MFRFRRLLVVVLASVGLFAALVADWTLVRPFARVPPKRAYYYWKTEWSASPGALQRLTRNRIDRLYIRFFDVVWDDAARVPQPVAPLRVEAPLPSRIDVVPVVYITNEVFLKIRYADVEALAGHVLAKVRGMAAADGVRFDEVQLDSDWSDGSRRNYFHFVELVSRGLRDQQASVSTTIRLHQIKYAGRTGIPPASRGMLMLYNFGRIEADSARSSIFNTADADRYSSFIAGYPLQLDVALPTFSWTVHSREGRVLGLLEDVTARDLASIDGFTRLTPNRFSATRSLFFHGHYFMADDRLLLETTTPQNTREAALLARHGAGWRKSYGTVALFDLDDDRSNGYSDAELESILATF